VVVALRFDVVKFVPINNAAPPVGAAYHVNVPPEQPEALNETVPFPHLEPSTPVGAGGIVFTVAITSVLGPSHPKLVVQETQKEVVAVMLGVVKGLPVPTCVPPVAASYHFNVPVHPVAVKFTVPVPHLEDPVPVGAAGTGLTVPVTCVLGLTHPFASVQLTQKLVVPLIVGE
jgi:hypothetical protein